MSWEHMRKNNRKFTRKELEVSRLRNKGKSRRLNFEDEIAMDQQIEEYQINKYDERELEIERNHPLRGGN